MPYIITDEQGVQHTFPTTTAPADMEAEINRRTAARPQATPEPASLPAGVQPGLANAMPANTPDPSATMVPLSAEAQRAKALLTMNSIGGANNRAGVMAASKLLESDPSYKMQMELSKQTADNAAKRQEARLAGAKILRAYVQLQDSFNGMPDDILNGAIGARNMIPLQENSPTYLPIPKLNIPIPGFAKPTTIDPATGAPIAGQITPVHRAAILNPNDQKAQTAWRAQNLFNHDVNVLNGAVMSNMGKGLNPSDERQKMYDATFHDFMRSDGRPGAAEVLEHAKNMIANDFYLSPAETEKILAFHRQALADAKAQALGPTTTTPQGGGPAAPQSGAGPVKQFKNKQTGALDSFQWDGTQWQKAQ